MSNASAIQDNLLPLIIVAKFVLYVKQTDNSEEGPVQLRNVICRFPQESDRTGTDIWPKETCDQIVLDHFVGCDPDASDLDPTFISIIRNRKLGAARDSLARCELTCWRCRAIAEVRSTQRMRLEGGDSQF